MSHYKYHPEKTGLYDFANEHDACGVGFVVNVDGQQTHKIIRQGIQVLERLEHRGAAGGDPDTGDGAGILFQLSHKFFTSLELGFDLPEAGTYGVGMVFLPQEPDLRERCEIIIDDVIRCEDLKLLGWRDVPVCPDKIGKVARSSQPHIRQFFVGTDDQSLPTDMLERKLYVIRRVVEKRVKTTTHAEDTFYICSLSARMIVYKGLLLAPQLSKFYTDLADENLESALAVVHQRYSTNTFPTWPLAQPFRYLAHNGEINTLRGNINQMRAREDCFESEQFGDDIKKLLPIIQENQSDSACLDNAVELFTEGGRDLAHAMMMLVPQAWGDKYQLGHDIRGFFDYHAGLMEPWDGPAALAFSNGHGIGALLDRNGLRPARYTITKDNFMVLASEAGVLDIPGDNVLQRGRLRPGEIIYVDLTKKRVMFDAEIKNYYVRRQPYRRWVDENRIVLHGLFDSVMPVNIDPEKLLFQQKIFGYTREDRDMVMAPMCQTGHEPTGSMGNDAALAVLSEKPQLLYNYFKQLFAQITNPAIDPIREEMVMSLTTFIGNQGNILDEKPAHAHLLKLKRPILTDEDISRLRKSPDPTFQVQTIKCGFQESDTGDRLETALEDLIVNAEVAVRTGHSVIILSDRDLEPGMVPIPALLATAAVNHHLIRTGLRTSAGIVVETGEAREIQHFVLLLGYGATAINPYLALETVSQMALDGTLESLGVIKAMENYIKSLCKGILKVMSKMGISTLRSYRGAQVFEAVGLSTGMIDKYFTGTASRINGIGLQEIAVEAVSRYRNAVKPQPGYRNLLENGGQYHFRVNGEKHLWTPETITTFQQAVRNNDDKLYAKYAEYINHQERHLCTLRGLFKFREVEPVPLEEVEPATEIVKRFCTGAMSFGSISKEAHETIAIAMNRLGGKSNSGEGGEDPERFVPMENGDSRCSAIKQVASGRFGVTAEYLASAKEIQIKIAQGAKPGEGGQLPGHKVNEVIARVRHSTPGVTLISPPPHHDIYSIEDLAQLIYDLKNSNPEARVTVKLVSEVGVGTVAAGVAKGHADMVLISGHDGGTGASPLTSIKHAGLPWELGLAETQQTLVLNNLRDRIRVQVDGQIKTGRDVIIGALLGAEEFGFATTILVSIGCVMMRKCHANTCPVGVATQDPDLRKRFKGKPEHVENFLMFIAEEVRTYLALLGLRSLDEAVGRSDLLNVDGAIDFWKTRNLDFSGIFDRSYDESLPVRCIKPQNHGIEKSFDNVYLLPQLTDAVNNRSKVTINQPITNVDRTAGTILSYEIAKRYGNAGLDDDTITVNFTGCAGQSFGAFLAHGVTFNLEGEANDYVGKGLSGGKLIIKPPKDSTFEPSKNSIAGNVLLYGATGGKAFFKGLVGERFAIRNSGAMAVVEGAGDHCCEYMTGGRIVVLGSTGFNFGAGMSGGIAYVYDESNEFDLRCNLDMVDLESVKDPKDIEELKLLIEEHAATTDSVRAWSILENWESSLPKFIKIFPVEYRKVLGQMMKEDEEAVERKKTTE